MIHCLHRRKWVILLSPCINNSLEGVYAPCYALLCLPACLLPVCLPFFQPADMHLPLPACLPAAPLTPAATTAW